jgi:hypothetical protein
VDNQNRHGCEVAASANLQGAGPGLRGEVVYLYAFDVANEIRLGEVAELLSEPPVPFVVALDRAAPRFVPFSTPLAIAPAPPVATLLGSPLRLLVRVYEVGVVSITVRAPFARAALADLVPFHSPLLGDGRRLDDYVRELCEKVRSGLDGCLVAPGPMTEPEAYTAFVLTGVEGESDAAKWAIRNGRAVAGLLTETAAERLSETQVSEVLRLQRSFEISDLVVIDWDAALVVDLDGSPDDVLFVLELANLQLEEFRWMDRSLDRYLDQAYTDLSRQTWQPFGSAVKVLRSLRRLRVDLAKLADEVTHITKFIGDWHLARVYLLARERFHLDQWRASDEQRLAQLDQLYTLVRGELYDRRMLWLEIVIIVFFAADLLILLLKA